MEFKKGQMVTWIITIMGSDTRSRKKVKSVTKKKVVLEGEDSISFNPETGQEINPSIMGASSRITFKGFSGSKRKTSKKVVKKKVQIKKTSVSNDINEKDPKKLVSFLNKHFKKKDVFAVNNYSELSEGFEEGDKDFKIITIKYGNFYSYEKGVCPSFQEFMNKSKKWYIEHFDLETIALCPC